MLQLRVKMRSCVADGLGATKNKLWARERFFGWGAKNGEIFQKYFKNFTMDYGRRLYSSLQQSK